MTADDATLLKEFATTESETAFTELVRRNVGLVYSAALRQVNGDSGLATDICQLVFIDLALKARSLPSKVVLAAWLHRATRFAVLAALRAERRRTSREHEAAIMQELHLTPPEADWGVLRPIIDAALDELNDSDREAVLRRYFRQQSFHEVGVALGLKENAARMRVERALDKLRTLLAHKGITTTGAALGAVLSLHALEVPPKELTLRLVQAALAASATTTTTTLGLGFLLMSLKTKIIVAVTAACLIGVIAYNHQRSGLQETVASLSTPQDGPFRSAQISSHRVASETSAPSTPADHGSLTADGAAAIRAVLQAPGRVANYPQPEMKRAILSFGARYLEALPILRQALQDPDWEVRLRATGGLAYLSVAASEAVPDLIALMGQARNNGDAMLIGTALAAIGVKPDAMPGLANALDGNRVAREMVDQLFPFLVQPDSQEAQEAAQGGSLEKALAGLAAADENEQVVALVRLASLGPAATAAIPALKEFLQQTHREDLKGSAEKLLTEIDAGFRNDQQDPENQRIQSERAREMAERFRTGQATVREMITALRELPEAIPAAAQALTAIGFEEMSRRGRENEEARQELSEATFMLIQIVFGNQPLAARAAAAEAYGSLQPMMPKLIYTKDELAPAFATVTEARKRLSEVPSHQVEALYGNLVEEARLQWQTHQRAGEVTDYVGSTVERFARELGTLDERTHTEFVAAMRKANPKFPEHP